MPNCQSCALPVRYAGEGKFHNGKKKKPVKKKEAKTQLGLAAAAYSPVDVSKTQLKSDILRGAKMEVLSFGKGPKSKDNISKLIKELGGQVGLLSCSPCLACIEVTDASIRYFRCDQLGRLPTADELNKAYAALDWVRHIPS